jgi:hypothetical protein
VRFRSELLHRNDATDAPAITSTREPIQPQLE